VSRNGDELETQDELLGQVAASVRRLLPPFWSAGILDEEIGRVEGFRPDAVFEVGPPGGPSARWVVEMKRTDRVSISELVHQARRVRQLAERPVLIVTPFANPALRRACVENDLSYADATGWVRLVSGSPAVFISHEGAAKASVKPRPTALSRLNGAAAGRIIRSLLAAEPPLGVRQLADVAGVSPGSVAKLLPTVVAAGAVERDRAGAVVDVRRRLLLERWIQDYSYRTTNKDLLWMLDPRGIDHVVARLQSVHGVVATGSLAARRFLPPGRVAVTPTVLAALYSHDPAEAARNLGLHPGTEGRANVVIAKPYDDRLMSEFDEQSRAVGLMQALADLLTLPGRSPDEADQLMDFLAETDPSWAGEDE
jgi:hypothetical protein